MSCIATIVKLRWSLLLAVMRKSVGQTIGYVIALLAALGVISTAANVGNALGANPAFAGPGAPLWDVLNVAMVFGGSLLTVLVVVVQVMFLGEGTAVSPRMFALYGIKDGTLTFALFIAGLCGVPTLTGVLSLLLLARSYRGAGSAAVIMGVVAAPLAVITIMWISKVVIALLTTLANTRRGKSVMYIAVFLLFVLACQLPNILVGPQDFASFNVKPLLGSSSVLAFTPLGAAFQLPFDAAAGNWAAVGVHLAVLVATWALCYLCCLWCLKRERLSAENHTVATTKGIGAFASAHDSVSGAISARLATYMRRDPRLIPLSVMPLLFVLLFAVQFHDSNTAVWQSLIWVCLFLFIAEGNGLAYDGNGFAMEVLSGVRGIDDRLGRVRAQIVLLVAYVALVTVVVFVITGDWRTSGGVMTGFTFAAAGLGTGLCALGFAEVISPVLMYPVASMERPMSSPQGHGAAQFFLPLLQLLGGLVLMLPTGIVAVVLALGGDWASWYWVMLPVSLANGVIVLVAGVQLGGKLLESRMLKVLSTLELFASLQH
ncbi:ABC transporter permease [Bifidobacterium panos]|uniref:ABC transporter permease n=1 Tax=Bifidobacterium panos TaxID=2675321 RepID=A0ABX1T0R1_9BIFI|nr:ABC transporter permease [Bifidobacterium sp. DSM 109963]NMN02576.1 ABC transporter permease [Bifidobacterium sp. DSM 109963]